MIDLGSVKILNNLAAEAVIKRLKTQLSTPRPGSAKPMNNWKSLSKSLEFKGGEAWFSEVRIEGNDYGMYLNEGINNIPFTRGSGVAHSAYIGMLQIWAVKKFGVNMAKAKQIAFAVATNQQKKSSSPDNPGWVNEIDNELSDIIGEEQLQNSFFMIEGEVNNLLNVRI
tara:strand:- start:495 stop:1001 length:507 start_codon:yes stop_codon:yes gene_type:complete